VEEHHLANARRGDLIVALRNGLQVHIADGATGEAAKL
jgi:hypothetical protein